jgi:hypothetical protein
MFDLAVGAVEVAALGGSGGGAGGEEEGREEAVFHVIHFLHFRWQIFVNFRQIRATTLLIFAEAVVYRAGKGCAASIVVALEFAALK